MKINKPHRSNKNSSVNQQVKRKEHKTRKKPLQCQSHLTRISAASFYEQWIKLKGACKSIQNNCINNKTLQIAIQLEHDCSSTQSVRCNLYSSAMYNLH